jgi:hypothetical protein
MDCRTATETGKRQEGGKMQGNMTDYQFKALITLVLSLLESSADKEEAANKLKKLIDEPK